MASCRGRRANHGSRSPRRRWTTVVSAELPINKQHSSAEASVCKIHLFSFSPTKPHFCGNSTETFCHSLTTAADDIFIVSVSDVFIDCQRDEEEQRSRLVVSLPTAPPQWKQIEGKENCPPDRYERIKSTGSSGIIRALQP